MESTGILAPMCAYTLLLFLLWALLGYVRVSGGRRGAIPAQYFRVGAGPLPSEEIVAVHHHYANQFEIPILFYLACLSLFVTQAVDGLALGLAWSFVALRAIHTAIVLIRNQPQVRVTPFVLSSLCVWGLWILLFVRVV